MALNLPQGQERARLVREMFDRIAPRYDRMNRLLTAGLDQRWRRTLLERLCLKPGERVVDLACGTGDLVELARRRGAGSVGVDFAPRMLAVARRRVGPVLVRADASALPLASECADAVTCAFALRNFTAIAPVLTEAARVLRPGGRLGLLEVDQPSSAVLRLGHGLYFRRMVPLLGSLLSDSFAYRYLPASTVYLPDDEALFDMLETAKFRDIAKWRLLGGVAQIVTASR